MQVYATFQEVSARKKNICLYPETAPRNKPKFIEESLKEISLLRT